MLQTGPELFEERKRDHIRHALDDRNQAQGLSGLDRVRLVHEALPELDWDQTSLAEPCLGRRLSTPFYVAGMTAGHGQAPILNDALAAACEARGWAMGVGSQRRDLERAEFGSARDDWKSLRARHPDLVVFANLGISQVIGATDQDVVRAIEALEPQALCVHANALQEAIQPEGTPRFAGALDRLARLCRALDVPVVLKETGCGFSARTLERLRETGLAAIDVSGLGGTHWGRIEGARAPLQSPRATAAQTFADWGVSTAESVLNARRALPGTEIWASGGVRSGLDAAKLIALGARRVGFARPALEAAKDPAPGGLVRWMETMEFELRTALFCTGCATPADLRGNEELWTVSTG
ncbi:MAG: type 2 isopentenyl-diphosphate Delta-isomerase [Bdellovibrionales bacterium]|nr:type 2 isopentenyl-diphosphate Delta-isomerase [Bdellovibrionales bacterium]